MDKKVFIILIAAMLIIGLVIIIGISVGLTRDNKCQEQQVTQSAQGHQSESGNYRFAAVSSDSGLCSSVGTEILARHHGSAVDAAIATLICLGVVNSQHVGLGGGHIMVLREQSRTSNQKHTMSLVARATAPLWVSPEYFEKEPEKKDSGAKSISIPCEVKGYYSAWERYGRVPWRELFQPSIKLCFEGWEVTESMAKSIQRELSTTESDPLLTEAYTKENGEPYKAGDIMKAPKLGRTLQRIAEEGVDTFYTGSLAKDIVDDIADAGGTINLHDMSSTQVLWSEPIRATLNNGSYHMYVAPPPSSGVITAFILKLLDLFPAMKSDETETNVTASAERLHLAIEAWEMAFALRKQAVGDKSFPTKDLMESLNMLVDDQYVRDMAKLIPDQHNNDDYTMLTGEDHMFTGGTSHLNVLTSEGGAVSVTSSVGSLFGSKVMGNRTGLIFNNDLSLFDLPSRTTHSVNFMYPRKRGQSSTTPLIVLNDNDDVVFLTGSSGGTRAITSTTYVTYSTLFRQQSLAYANSKPRIHAQFNTSLYYDEDMPKEVLERLAAKGHTDQVAMSTKFPYLGVNQAIDNRACLQCGTSCNKPCIEAISDWRKGGKPDGY